MDLLNFFQFLQALLAIFVVACLCINGPVKHHCHVALVVLVISMMIIPPFGHTFLSMKEGLNNGYPYNLINCQNACDASFPSMVKVDDKWVTNPKWQTCIKNCQQEYTPP